ncbi:MAG: DUF4446 family protein [Dehalococcoidales bacterium]|nr:DUF4446 family protein [Dehalococcoidales bacterium]
MTELQQMFSQYALFAWLLLLALVLLALAWQSSLRRRVDLLSRRYVSLSNGVDGASMLDVLDRQVTDVRDLGQKVEAVANQCQALDEKVELSLRRVGMIRFNPFSDTGGDQSFALAVLDDRGDGFVISSIFGRAESRLYAKPVKDGRSKYPLSAEEEQAICQASLMR